MRFLAKLFLIICLWPLVSCSSIQQKSSCSHLHQKKPSKYIEFQDFKKKLEQKENKSLFLVFGADWCRPCDYLHKRLVEAGIANNVLFLDVEETWAFLLSRQLGVEGLPTLVVLQEKKKNIIRNTPGEILIYLLANASEEV